MMKNILGCLFLLIALAACPLGAAAQMPAKVVQAGKQAVKASEAAARAVPVKVPVSVPKVAVMETGFRVLPPNPGSMVQPALMPVNVPAGTSDLLSVTNPAARNQRPLWQQIQRDIKAAQLKKLHAEQIELFEAKQALPKLEEKEAFFTENLYDYSPDTAIRAESIALPVMTEPGMLYRGLALDKEGKSIANILDNGLRVKDAGDDSSTLITAYASHSQVAAHVLQTAATKVTNLTNSPQSAVYWAYKRLTAELQIPVVVQVSGRTETSSIVVETHDIPAGNLTVLAKLKINDHARWCKIERAYTLGGKPAFKVTPFEYRLKEPAGK